MNLTMKKNGFVVITSVIVLSVVLLLLAHALSISGYFQAEGALDAELKELSYFTAYACIDRALYKLSQDLDYTGDETLPIGAYTCTIQPLTTEQSSGGGAGSPTDTIIRASATTNGASTKLRMVVDEYLAFISLTEE